MVSRGSEGQGSIHQLLGDLVWSMPRRIALRAEVARAVKRSKRRRHSHAEHGRGNRQSRAVHERNKFTFPVLLGHAYADSQGINSIPRNWVVSLDGKIMFEGIGFGNKDEEWMKRAAQLIEKVKGAN